MDDTRRALGERIRRQRERNRWTQAQLAARLGVSTKTVSNWEQGRNDPRNSLGALREAFGTDLESDGMEPIEESGEPGTSGESFIEFTIETRPGVRVVVKGPVEDQEELERAVDKLLAKVPESHQSLDSQVREKS